MTNFERYKDEILAIVKSGSTIALENSVPRACSGLPCSKCDLDKEPSITRCRCRVTEWLYEEYQEPPVDWSKVPVDAKIEVRDSEHHGWTKRHFAYCDESGRVFAWANGHTSFTIDEDGGEIPDDQIWKFTSGWEYARLYQE